MGYTELPGDRWLNTSRAESCPPLCSGHDCMHTFRKGVIFSLYFYKVSMSPLDVALAHPYHSARKNDLPAHQRAGLSRKSVTRPLSAANVPLCFHIHSTSDSLQAATQSGCYSVVLSQRYNRTTCSRLSGRPNGLSVWLTKAKL